MKEKLTEYMDAHPTLDAILWFFGAFACITLLVWFLLFSGYGAPPEFIYDQF